jgi:hypothetical protein
MLCIVTFVPSILLYRSYLSYILYDLLLLILDTTHIFYRMKRSVRQYKPSNSLTTSLAEDVFFVLGMQQQVLHGFLVATKLVTTRAGSRMLVQGLVSLLSIVQESQRRYQQHVLWSSASLEDSCAAANDFFRMSEQMEEFTCTLLQKYPFLAKADEEWEAAAVECKCREMIVQFSRDAVCAAEQVQVVLFRHGIHPSSVASDLFSVMWEDDWTHNQVALQLVHIADDYLTDCQEYLETDFLYHKAVVVTLKAVVCFYVRCLIEKADSVTRRRTNRERLLNRTAVARERRPFRSRKKALIRMLDDIAVVRDFFCDKVSTTTTTSSRGLLRIVTAEIFVLELIHECLEVSPTDSASLESFIVVIHKRTGGDALVTRYFVGDLWLLVTADSDQPHRGKQKRQLLEQTLASLEPDLRMVSNGMNERSSSSTTGIMSQASFVCLSDMLKVMYEDRIAQGVLPLCWPFLPKVMNANGNAVLTEKIRSLTRNIAQLRWR